MNFKKIAAILFGVTVLSAGTVFADFVDMPKDKIKNNALTRAVENGLLTGYENNEIKPDNNITRAEMGTILVRAMGAVDTEDISIFEDMSENAWYYDSMSKAVAMGAFKGDGENLNPEVNITFQEAFIVLSRIFNLDAKMGVNGETRLLGDPLDGYYDEAKVADWAREDVSYILGFGYWEDVTGYLRPTDYITRAEFAVLMDNLVSTYIDEPGEYTDFEDGNVVVRCGDVVISGYDYADGNVYTSDGVDGKVTFEDSDFDCVVMRGGEVDFLSGSCYVIRIQAGKELHCHIGSNAQVKYFDGNQGSVSFDPVTIG